MMNGQLSLMKTRRFLPLFATQFLGAFNDNALKNAFLIWFTYSVTSYRGIDAPMMVTIAAGLFILPFFLFSSIAGQVADKYEKSGLIQVIKLVEIVLMVACLVSFLLKSTVGLLIILFLMGVQSTFFGPLKYSLLPEYLKDQELIGGNGLIEAGTFLSILLGTIFGGIIIRLDGGAAIFSSMVIAFAVLGWCASRFIPLSTAGDRQLRLSMNIFTETAKIVRYAKREPSVWLSILGISWFWLIGATFLTQLPTYTRLVIKGDEYVVTFFFTLFSVGIGVGSMWCNQLLKGEINARLVPYSALGISVSIALFYLASWDFAASDSLVINDGIGLMAFLSDGVAGWWVVLSLLILSTCAGIYIVPLYAIMQYYSRGQYLSRIIAANNIMNALLMVLGSFFVIALFALDWSVLSVLFSLGVINIPIIFLLHRINSELEDA